MKAKLAHKKYKELNKNNKSADAVELEDWNDFFLTADSVSIATLINEKSTEKIIMKVMIELIEELLIKQ